MNENTSLLLMKYNEYLFWIFGLINNITFIILLSASQDLMHNNIRYFGICAISPVFFIKITAPFWIKYKFLCYKNRIYIITLLYIISYLLISLVNNLYFKLVGIAIVGTASAIGEITFIPIASIISNKCISYWSSGSGFAGLIGSGYYILMTQVFNLSSNFTLLLLSWMPLLIIICFNKLHYDQNNIEYLDYIKITKEDFKKWMFNYVSPLLLVYFFEYSINLGILEKINNNKIEKLYPRYNFCYQFGVLMSRSFNILFPKYRIEFIWIFPILQMINFIFFILLVFYKFIPYICIIYLLIFYEGLLGGFSYLFIFQKIKKDISEDKRELSASITTLGEVTGQIFATIFALFFK